MKKIITLVTVSAFILACFQLAAAQKPAKVSRIGYMSLIGTATSDPSFAALREGLRELGYSEGKNIVF
ncbi:MAG TPA: hypothetical protein VGA09_15395, partial [Candidatus Binatia bacterium]